jgi:hypothetical protein
MNSLCLFCLVTIVCPNFLLTSESLNKLARWIGYGHTNVFMRRRDRVPTCRTLHLSSLENANDLLFFSFACYGMNIDSRALCLIL